MRDPDALLILHDVDFGARDPTVGTDLNRQLVLDRLQHAGVDLTRCLFFSAQPHHRLLALNALSDVVLDSYYAGPTRATLALGPARASAPGWCFTRATQATIRRSTRSKSGGSW